MKRNVVFLLLCLLCYVPGAWAANNKLTAVYTYDGDEVRKDSASGFLKIEAKREVQFIYTPSSYETAESYGITFTDGSTGTMVLSGEKYVCLHTFPSSGEVGISMDAPSFTLTSADVSEAMPFELNPPRLTMKTNETNHFIKFNTRDNEAVSDWEVALEFSQSMISAQYYYDKGLDVTPRILVSAGTSEGTANLTVTFTHKGDNSRSFQRVGFITIKNSSDSTGGSGGGGGCSAGLTGLGLLALLPFMARRKTK